MIHRTLLNQWHFFSLPSKEFICKCELHTWPLFLVLDYWIYYPFLSKFWEFSNYKFYAHFIHSRKHDKTKEFCEYCTHWKAWHFWYAFLSCFCECVVDKQNTFKSIPPSLMAFICKFEPCSLKDVFYVQLNIMISFLHHERVYGSGVQMLKVSINHQVFAIDFSDLKLKCTLRNMTILLHFTFYILKSLTVMLFLL